MTPNDTQQMKVIEDRSRAWIIAIGLILAVLYVRAVWMLVEYLCGAPGCFGG